MRMRPPSLLVEVGTRHSTRWFARAATDSGHPTRVVAIDPAPRARLAGLRIEIIRSTVQDAGDAPFAALAAGDMLSIDGRHVLMPGTDVDFLFNRVLPLLTAGVPVHIHDVLLPQRYPAEWAWRGYNEQLAVWAMLQMGDEIASARIEAAVPSAISSPDIRLPCPVRSAFTWRSRCWRSASSSAGLGTRSTRQARVSPRLSASSSGSAARGPAGRI
jgi:hypothetical protein